MTSGGTLAEEFFHSGASDVGAARIIRIRNEEDARLGLHRSGHRLEIVGIVLQGNRCERRAVSQARELVDDERRLGEHHVIGRRGVRPHQEVEQLVRSVAVNDLTHLDAMKLCQFLAKCVRGRIRVTVDLRDGAPRRLHGSRARPERVFVRRELDGVGHPELPSQLFHWLPRFVGGEHLDGRGDAGSHRRRA